MKASRFKSATVNGMQLTYFSPLQISGTDVYTLLYILSFVALTLVSLDGVLGSKQL